MIRRAIGGCVRRRSASFPSRSSTRRRRAYAAVLGRTLPQEPAGTDSATPLMDSPEVFIVLPIGLKRGLNGGPGHARIRGGSFLHGKLLDSEPPDIYPTPDTIFRSISDLEPLRIRAGNSLRFW